MPDEIHPFVQRLIAEKDNRALMATLKRGLGKPPGTVIEMFRFVGPFVHDGTQKWERDVLFLIASLFASHTHNTTEGNLGSTMRHIWNQSNESSSIERRFVQLLNSHSDELPNRLRQTIGLAVSQDVPVNYSRLYTDLRYWNSENKWVQQRWAASFWEGVASKEIESEAITESRNSSEQ